MAVWEVRVVFGNGTRQWENVWHIDVGSLDDVPAAVITELHDYHSAFLLPIFTLLKIVRRPAGTHDAFIEAIFNTVGTRVGGTGFAMPLFNTVRVLLTGGVGRPGLKFLRGLLDTGDIADNSTDILATVVAAVEAATLTLLGEIVTAGCEVLEGAAGRPVTSASTQLTVQMRQEHRKRKRSV